MNKQEVLYLPVKEDGLIFSTVNDECKIYYRTLDGEEVSTLFKAKSKEELLDLLKPVVPKFVAEWIEECKHDKFYALHGAYANMDEEMKCWRFRGNNSDLFAKAWLAYPNITIEQEELYTVEIPNPVLTDNSDSVTVLMKLDLGVVLTDVVDYIGRKQESVYHLTESEIKEDFDWAWQWAVPVEVE